MHSKISKKQKKIIDRVFLSQQFSVAKGTRNGKKNADLRIIDFSEIDEEEEEEEGDVCEVNPKRLKKRN